MNTTKLIVIDFNDTIVIIPKYAGGFELIKFVKLYNDFDWGEIKIEYDELEFKNIKIITKEYNKKSKEPATLIIEKLLLLENFNTNKNIILVLKPINHIITTRLFYEYLLKNTLYIPTSNNLGLEIDTHNENVISLFKDYLKKNYPNLLSKNYIDDTISYFKNTILWSDSDGYNVYPEFDKTLSNVISKYIADTSKEWLNLIYNENSYIKYTHPLNTIYNKFILKKLPAKLTTFDNFISTLHVSKNKYDELTKFIGSYKISDGLQNYISNSVIKIINNNEYERDKKLYQHIMIQNKTDINIKPWCPIFLIPSTKNLVMTGTKIASTWLISNYLKNDNNLLDTNESYDRNIFSFSVSDDSSIKSDSVSVNNPIHKKIQSDIETKYNNIISNVDNGILYILYRNPIERYSQSLYQDIRVYLNELYSQVGRSGIISLYTDFIKNSPNEDILIKTLNTIPSSVDDITNLNDSFFLKNHELTKIIIDGLFSCFFSPEIIQNDSTNIKINLSGINSSSYRFNVLTPHYSSYLTNVLELYNKNFNNNRIKFLDIDVDDISMILLNRPRIKNESDNNTPIHLKKLWKERLANFLHNNDKVLTSLNETLNSDLIAYNNINKIKRNDTKDVLNNYLSYVYPIVPVQMGKLNNNIVITSRKIASKWLTKHYYIENMIDTSGIYYNSPNDIYRCIFDNHLNIIDNSITNNALNNSMVNVDVKKIIESNHDSLSNIISGKDNGKIYILYRNPEDRYIQSIREDISIFLEKISESNQNNILNFYLSFIKNLPLESYNFLYKRLILDMTNFHNNSWIGGLRELDSYITNRKKYDNPIGIDSLYKIIINGIINWFIQGFDYKTSTLDIPFEETLLLEELGNKYTPIHFRNYITSHYTSYLNPLLNYYIRLNQPPYIHFIDIDTENINDIILGIQNNNDKINSTTDSLKSIWKDTFIKHLENNIYAKKQISNHLISDVIAYNNIKNIKK